MTLLTIEKEGLFTIKTSALSSEKRAVLADILENIHDRVLNIEKHHGLIGTPRHAVSVTAVVNALDDLTRIELGRAGHSLPYPPKEPLTSLRTLGSCMLDWSAKAIQKGAREIAPLKEASARLVATADQLLARAHYMPHDEDLITMDSQIFAACKRICQGLASRA